MVQEVCSEKGFLQGSQSYLDYLPEKHTDFIFTLFSEEFGFFGSLFILFLYAIIVWRLVKIGNITRSNFGKLYCYSFATAFFIFFPISLKKGPIKIPPPTANIVEISPTTPP